MTVCWYRVDRAGFRSNSCAGCGTAATAAGAVVLASRSGGDPVVADSGGGPKAPPDRAGRTRAIAGFRGIACGSGSRRRSRRIDRVGGRKIPQMAPHHEKAAIGSRADEEIVDAPRTTAQSRADRAALSHQVDSQPATPRLVCRRTPDRKNDMSRPAAHWWF